VKENGTFVKNFSTPLISENRAPSDKPRVTTTISGYYNAPQLPALELLNDRPLPIRGKKAWQQSTADIEVPTPFPLKVLFNKQQKTKNNHQYANKRQKNR
jgi:hypothetical protein